MLKPINRKAPEDRRSVPLNPASLPTIVSGQVCQTDANGFAVLADGASVVPDPMWAFSDTARLDTTTAESITVLEGQFTALISADGYTGTPAKGDALQIGTGGNVGKLETLAVTADATTLQAIVAYCVAPPDADNYLKIKVIR